MDYQEFSDRFDVLYNNITSNQAPGLTEYEKSVFLTKAQDELLKNYFNPKGNKYGEGFDGNPKRQMDFAVLMNTWNLNATSPGNFDTRSGVYSVSLPSNIMFIINERLTVRRMNKEVNLTVRPISFDEYDRHMSKPYKRPVKYEAWRLNTQKYSDINNNALRPFDLIAGPNDNNFHYYIRYIRRPKPIIVGDLDSLKINGYEFGNLTSGNYTQGCELGEAIHEEILQRAVELAKVSWTATGQDNAQMVLQAGQRSE